MPKSCSLIGCLQKYYCKSYCRIHYERAREGRKLNSPFYRIHMSMDDLVQIRSYIEQNKNEKTRAQGMSSCWEWARTKDSRGYGRTWVDGRRIFVHRIAMVVYRGFSLESRLWVCHHCDNPSCFNPEHLYIGTAKENSSDMVNRKRSNPPLGERQGRSFLNEHIIRRVRLMHKIGMKYIDIDNLLHLKLGHARSICVFKIWKHILPVSQ